MRHVTVEFTNPTSYKITVDGETKAHTCKLIPIPGRDPKKQDYINPAHNEAWSRMLEVYNYEADA